MIRVMTSPTRRYPTPGASSRRRRLAIPSSTLWCRSWQAGLADLSMPAIAREAGLSVRTIYRHFPTKRDLLIALGEHMDQRAGYQWEPVPRSPGGPVPNHP